MVATNLLESKIRSRSFEEMTTIPHMIPHLLCIGLLACREPKRTWRCAARSLAAADDLAEDREVASRAVAEALRDVTPSSAASFEDSIDRRLLLDPFRGRRPQAVLRGGAHQGARQGMPALRRQRRGARQVGGE